jgi:hypothetical protein
MGQYRSFTLAFMSGLTLFVLANAAIWSFYTSRVLSQDDSTTVGDLSRMGYVISIAERKHTVIDLPKRHLEGWEFSGGKVDLITIGDSFSNGGGGGKNPFYQDLIASEHNMTVLNLLPYRNKQLIETILILANSGYLEKHGVKYVILERLEGCCVQSLSERIDFALTDEIEKIEDFYSQKEQEPKRPRIHFVNTGNLKFLLYSVLYNFSDRALFSNVYIRKLNSRCFSSEEGDKLLFYKQDIKNIHLSNGHSISVLNDNLNKAAQVLQRHGVKLYFMPPPDKYNLYSDRIVDNPYPKSTFFEEIRKRPKNYSFIDCKAILRRELDRGEMDLYHADDAHWTWRASKAISKAMTFERAGLAGNP